MNLCVILYCQEGRKKKAWVPAAENMNEAACEVHNQRCPASRLRSPSQEQVRSWIIDEGKREEVSEWNGVKSFVKGYIPGGVRERETSGLKRNSFMRIRRTFKLCLHQGVAESVGCFPFSSCRWQQLTWWPASWALLDYFLKIMFLWEGGVLRPAQGRICWKSRCGQCKGKSWISEPFPGKLLSLIWFWELFMKNWVYFNPMLVETYDGKSNGGLQNFSQRLHEIV